VPEANQVTIYDGDDPSLPMWRVNADYARPNGGSPVAVSAKNGRLFIGMTVGWMDYRFIEDKRTSGSNGSYVFRGEIATDHVDTSNKGSLGSSYIVNNAVNDVAMTVLPNAPIDAATGLPVPTIAVATNGGVSVIKDDGTVVSKTTTQLFSSTLESLYFHRYIAIYGDEVAVNWEYTGGGGAGTILVCDLETLTAKRRYGSSYATPSDHSFLFEPPLKAIGSCHTFTKDGLAVRTQETSPRNFSLDATVVLVKENPEDIGNTLAAQLTSTYNTGWMNGAIKLATLSDTDDTDVTGSELVTNGDFPTDFTGWTDQSTGSHTLAVVSGEASLIGTDTSNRAWIEQAITTVSGKQYVLSADITVNSGGFIFGAGPTSTSTALGSLTVAGQSLTFTASSTTTYIGIRTANAGGDILVDNVSVRLAEPDRSVNGNGLQVYGTITKDPVATGADLVAYSGFSAANYLEQPYNSDLDFGTGDFCVMGWAKTTNSSGVERYCGRNSGSSSKRFSVYYVGTTGLFTLYTSDGTATSASKAMPNDGSWHHFVCKRENGNLQVFIDGVGGSTTSSTVDVTVTGGESLFVGAEDFGSGIDSPATLSSLALLRISATAPTAEQIAKIYEDEKFLFQEGAQATLYGSSDAVTALAHDEVTDLLHVGTSAGRSVFQGLRRVDNTTDAVGVAISAYDDLVVED
jgi:hypothetical protein